MHTDHPEVSPCLHRFSRTLPFHALKATHSIPWPNITLGELCIDKPQYGANAKAITRSNKDQPRYIRITDIDSNGELISMGVAADILDSKPYILSEGDLLIARSGNTVGKSYLHPKGAEPSLFAGYLIRFQLSTKLINPRFAFFFTKSGRYNSWLDSKRRVAGQPNINGTEYASLEIPLPPLPEQDRIVEILDQADSLRQQRRQADALSRRILPALFQEMFGDPLARDSKWQKKPLGSMGTLDRGVSKNRPRNSPELLGGPYPLIQTGDIANASGVIKAYSTTYSEVGLAQSKLWPARTLCITIAANIGKTAILDFEACFPDSVVGFIPNAETNVEYVQCLFHFFQPMLEMNAPQAAQKNINLKTLRELEAPAPPHALQERFGESVRLLRNTVVGQTTSAATLETLFQTLLHRAFDGSLTAKWREGHTKELLQEMEHQARKYHE